MPQMTSVLGESANIIRWVTSSCIPTDGGVLFGGVSDAVLLDVDRCDGDAFGGCQMHCPLMWKTAWLSDGETKRSRTSGSLDQSEALETLSRIASDNALCGEGFARCQATQLVHISSRLQGSRASQYAKEMNMNRVSMSTIATSLCGGLLARVTGAAGDVYGDLKRTPVADFQLQPGDRVKVKSKAEIVKTLDADGKNRGLWFDPVMLRYCGQELKVTKRIKTLVDETSGQIRHLKVPSVVLDDLRCDSNQRRFCSRLLNLFWREVWLEPVST